MPVIKVLPHPEYCPEGRDIEASPGASICEALLENGIPIEHACEMSCACTTCHVVVRVADRQAVGLADQDGRHRHHGGEHHHEPESGLPHGPDDIAGPSPPGTARGGRAGAF